MTESAVSFESVCVRLGGRPVLEDITLRIEPGELVGVIGPNGAGKSTLLMLVNGLRRASEGSVTVLGRQPDRLSSAQLARLRREVGYVPQLPERARNVPVSVRQVVEIARIGRAGIGRGLAPEDRDIVEAWLHKLGMAHLADRPFNALSGGEQRKIHLARALAQEPKVLLLDEPASNLDIRWQEELTGIIQDLYTQTSVTTLMVTHEVQQLPSLCRKMALIHEGRLEAVGAPSDVLKTEVLRRVFGERMEVLERNGRYHLLPAGRREARARY